MKRIRIHATTLFLLLGALALLLAAPSCGKGAGAKPASDSKETKKEEGEGHEEGDHSECDHEDEEDHEGEGHGREWLIDIGEHTFLGEVDYDAEEGVLILTVLDHKSREPHPHEIKEAKLNLALPDGSKQFAMEPLRGDEDLIGETTRYKVSDPALKGHKELKGRVNLTIDGKSYVCDLKAAH
ncbi:MAG: hypothetical protein ACYS47_00350 [Planctomycetota bacterium]|jgi:hypothetical protein